VLPQTDLFDGERSRLEATFFELTGSVEDHDLSRGMILRELHDRKLYRPEHRSWSAYCGDRLRIGKRHADNLIAFVRLREWLQEMGAVVPNSEREGRPLTKKGLTDEQRLEISRRVHAEGGFTTAGHERVGVITKAVASIGAPSALSTALVVANGGAITPAQINLPGRVAAMAALAASIDRRGPHALPTALDALDRDDAQAVAEDLQHLLRFIIRALGYMRDLPAEYAPEQERMALVA
jgi:hypothetical protein